jgi:hypothetical protein
MWITPDEAGRAGGMNEAGEMNGMSGMDDRVVMFFILSSLSLVFLFILSSPFPNPCLPREKEKDKEERIKNEGGAHGGVSRSGR